MQLLDPQAQATERKRLYGVYPAEVTAINDEDGQGRVKVRLPWSPDDGAGYEVWARLATFMAGADRGAWFIPDRGDEVLLAFEGGDPRRPYVIGALWNGTDTAPESMDGAQRNYKKSIVSRRNIRVTLDDTEGGETVTIETPGGQKVTVKDGPGLVELRGAGNVVKLAPSGVTVSTSSKVTIEASSVEVKAIQVTVNAAFSKFSGVVITDTLISNSVISASYSPGAGNIW